MIEHAPAPLARAVRRLSGLLRQWDGPLTRELLRRPGRFGLGQVPAGKAPDATTTAVCGYCSTGCGLDVHLRDGEAVNVSPRKGYPVNRGAACPKGWQALDALSADDRATEPLVRDGSGRLAPTDWDTALKTFVARVKDVQRRHGPDSVAFLSTGQIVCEEMALLGALAKFGMGIRHGDGNTRQCMATAVSAYKESFGFDAPPYTYADFEASDVLVFVGANPCIAHPIMWERVWRNPHDPTIVTIDPRRTETAEASSRHLAIKPKSDLALFYAVAHVLFERDALDHAFIESHTSGLEAFRAHVADYPPETVAEAAGIAAADIRWLAETIARGKAVSFWWTMGVNQSHEGTRTAQALINLALMTGNVGRPGTGANSITGQCNAMGSRLFSNTTSLLGGHDFKKPADREKVAGALGIDAARIPETDSWAYHEIVEGIVSGRIKALWVIATNGAHSWIGQSDFRRYLDRLDFLAVQDMYPTTETAQRADLILPAAGWGEKEGTFINSERRFGLVKKVARAPGKALADFNIFKLIAHYYGCGGMLAEWDSPEAVFRILQRVTRGQPCEITGIRGYGHIEARGGIQWPWTEADAAAGEPDTERRLFEDGCFPHADGRARFVFDPPRAMPEAPDAEYPLLLLTGRGTSAQWHTETRTGKSAVLRTLHPEQLQLELHPDDAARIGARRGEAVAVESRRGRARALVHVTRAVRPGEVFLPMHDAATNRLTNPAFDPHSKQPAYKGCAVRVRRLAAWESEVPA